MSKIIRKTYQASETKAAPEDRTLVVKISTSTPDRSHDVVVPEGVKLDNYLKNPVVAFGHNYSGLSIGKTVEITKVADGIIAKVEFVPKGVYPLADQLYEMYKGGFMNAWSIGFIPQKWSDREDRGRTFEEWELLEYSAVLVPDNPEALTLLRSKGVDVEPLEKAMETMKEEEVQEDKEEVKKTHVQPEEKKMEVKEEKKEDVKPEEKETPQKTTHEIPHEDVDAPEIINIETDINTKRIVLHFADSDTLEFTGQETILAYFDELQSAYRQVKEGRVLSDKNRKLISTTISQLKTSIESLEMLLQATDSHDEKPDKTVQVLVPVLRQIDKLAGIALRDIKTNG